MYELSVALKYLLPKKKSLSAALISLMSVAVISLVVWLVLVFLSVTSGIEKGWIQRLTSVHAPIRISPTDLYYQSYYYQVDSLSLASNYTYKTIGEKKAASTSDPFVASLDASIPYYIPEPIRTQEGELLDPVKTLFSSLKSLQNEGKNISFQDYEVSGALMRIQLKNSGSTLSQMSYLLSIPEENPNLKSILFEGHTHPLKLSEKESEKANYAHFVNGVFVMPNEVETPVILPKNYYDNGVSVGDTGFFSYIGTSGVSTQEQKIPFQVAGFYDPGVMAVGNKCVFVPDTVTRDIQALTQTFSPDGTPTNGVFVWCDLSEVSALKEKIRNLLLDGKVAPFWKVETYENFDFAKDLLTQFRSDKTLLLMIASIILVVAICNIISLLVLLVNDKKKEIAILVSMGASSKSIAAIFGLCGMAMGLISCSVGSFLASITMKNIESLVSFLSLIQGRNAFNPAFFGKSLPNSLSIEALMFVLIATPILSFIAGLVPALKASKTHPSGALRSE